MKKFYMVLVTYNRALLLQECLRSIFENDISFLQKVLVIDNCSTDNTKEVVDLFARAYPTLIKYKCTEANLGGSGGFALGTKLAYSDGAEWIGLIDDDILLDKNCLKILNKYTNDNHCLIAVREDKEGNLAEFAAVEYNLKNPFILNPKVSSVKSHYCRRVDMPEQVEIIGASFEGFFFPASLVGKIGIPHKEYFIFSDDFDYSFRARKAGYPIYAVRDALIVRQLPYRKNDLNSWKTYFIWRNFFTLHFLYGDNIFVKIKPLILAIGLQMFSLITLRPLNAMKILLDSIRLTKTLKSKINLFE